MFSFEVDHFILDTWSQFGSGPSKSLFIVIKKKKMSHSFIYTNQHSEFFSWVSKYLLFLQIVFDLQSAICNIAMTAHMSIEDW